MAAARRNVFFPFLWLCCFMPHRPVMPHRIVALQCHRLTLQQLRRKTAFFVVLVQRGASSFWPSRTMTAPHTQQWKVSLFRPALSVLSGRLRPSCAFASNLQEPFLLHAFQLQVSVTSMFGLVCIGGVSLLVFAIQDKLFGVVGRPLTSGQWRVLVLLCQQLWPWSGPGVVVVVCTAWRISAQDGGQVRRGQPPSRER